MFKQHIAENTVSRALKPRCELVKSGFREVEAQFHRETVDIDMSHHRDSMIGVLSFFQMQLLFISSSLFSWGEDQDREKKKEQITAGMSPSPQLRQNDSASE